MRYMLNNSVCFLPETRELSLVDDEQTAIVISNQACRLLLEMIKRNGENLSREHLLKSVWEDYGLKPSNNNLYMAISEIRKALTSLGLERTVIYTIPKIGFKLNCNIVPIEVNRGSHITQKKAKPKKTFFILLAGTITTLLVSVFLFSYNHGKVNITEKGSEYIGDLGKCKIHRVNDGTLYDKDEITKIIIDKTELGKTCKKEPIDIFYSDFGMKDQHLFVGACSLKRNSENSPCKIIRIM